MAEAWTSYVVPYADTDRMGVVYYANYLIYFERARTQLLNTLGYSYTEMERDGYGLPVVEAHVDYKRPAGYDDTLRLHAKIAWFKGCRMQLDCSVYKDTTLLANGHTVHACLDLKRRKPCALPTRLIDVLPVANSDG